MEVLHLKKNFLYRLSSAKMVVEYAFGRLKDRFGILRKDNYTDLKTALNIMHSLFFTIFVK